MSIEDFRKKYSPKLPLIFKDFPNISFLKEDILNVGKDVKNIFPNTFSNPMVSFKTSEKKESYPLRIGVLFSGGTAPGGHNVIYGLYHALMSLHPESMLFGFLDGPSGVIENNYIHIRDDHIQKYKNTGGFDLIGSSRTKIEKEDHLHASLTSCKELKLDGLVIIGGDDSNTNAAILAEYFLKNGCKTKVVGVPKTIDGDLKNEHILISFGFDTATKVYSEMISNLQKDAKSSKKYYHFIKLMGRSASHIALECALKTHPNITLISEEVEDKGSTLNEITKEIADIIEKRASLGKNYGVVLIPEGIIEFIKEMRLLIKELNDLLAKENIFIDEIKSKLSEDAKNCFLSLPEDIQRQLLLTRDPHGNVQVSKIETEKLILEKVKKELQQRKEFKGKFNAVTHFFGYEGRSSMPSNFDADYCFSLGYVSVSLIKENLTGYIACVSDLNKGQDQWKALGIPLVGLMNIEKRKGKEKPVIKKALVDLFGKPFLQFSKIRRSLEIEDDYKIQGPIQFFGEKEVVDTKPMII